MHLIILSGSTRHSSARPKVELRDDELFEVMSVQLFRDSISRALQNLSDSYLKQLTISNAAGMYDYGSAFPIESYSHLVVAVFTGICMTFI